MARLAATIDEIKSQAGVAQFITTAHTSPAKHDEGTEHARGATALDDLDVRMVMTGRAMIGFCSLRVGRSASMRFS